VIQITILLTVKLEKIPVYKFEMVGIDNSRRTVPLYRVDAEATA